MRSSYVESTQGSVRDTLTAEPMTESEVTQIRQWAARQLADYDAVQPGTLFAEGVELSVSQAYEVQAAVTQLRCDRGDRVIGYKVGCTSPTIRAQLGIDHSISGSLFGSERHGSANRLSRTRFANLAIEGELAIELSREPVTEDFRPGEMPLCVSAVFPVIELHNHVIRGDRPTAGELIANNAIHAGFCAGERVSRKDVGKKQSGDAASLSIFVDDQLIAECSGRILVQTVERSVHWLFRQSRERGERLLPGQIILTGSVPPLIPIEHDCTVRVDAAEFGSVRAHFES